MLLLNYSGNADASVSAIIAKAAAALRTERKAVVNATDDRRRTSTSRAGRAVAGRVVLREPSPASGATLRGQPRAEKLCLEPSFLSSPMLRDPSDARSGHGL